MKYIVVTDLDGTLLDHQTYEFTTAKKAIAQLQQQQIPIILNSSKTQAEISAIRSKLNNQEPFVCENGGVLCGLNSATDIQHLGTPRQEFLGSLRSIKQKLELNYQGFAEATVEDVVRWTGLTVTAAKQAMQREATEPLLWQDTEPALSNFRQELEQLGLQCVKGGRFYHVMGIFNKASCFSKLKAYYSQGNSEEIRIIALGDSPNDLPMLEQADHAVVIPTAKKTNLSLNHNSVFFATQLGPAGWQSGIEHLLNSIL
jgi:mannosyl-3-phosphoglycerate phosphatase